MGCLKIPYPEKNAKNPLRVAYRNFANVPEKRSKYYPFGLIQQGISSKAFGKIENKKKYNGIEYEKDLDLSVYDAQFRELDPQVGRWWQIDPKTDEMYMWSTYASNFDNPIRFADPLGDMPDMDCCGGVYALPVGIGVGSGFAIGSTSAAALAPAAVVVVPVVLAVGVTVYAVRNPESLVGIGNSNVPLNAQAATARYHQQNAWQSPKFMSGLGGTTQKLGATLKAQGEKQVAAQKTQGSTKPVQQGSQRQFNLPKPPKGRGSVPPDQRDPKRIYSKKERSDMLDKQNGVCVGCGQQKTVNQVDGHHIIRHADGGKTNVENGAALCKNCHTQIHQ